MPFSTSLPAPSIEYVRREQWPVPVVPNTYTLEAVSYGAIDTYPSMQYGGASGPVSVGPLGSVGGSGFGGINVLKGGKFMIAFATTSAVGGALRIFNQWWPAYGPATELAPGSTVNVGSVVMTIDLHIALSTASFGFTDLGTGWWFMPNIISPNMNTHSPAGSGPVGGFGFLIGDDGSGGSEIQYVSMNGASVLERVSMPAGAVGDVTQRNTVQLSIVTAASGRDASLTARINDVAWVVRDFDDVSLFRPNTLNARSMNFGLAYLMRGGAGDQFICAYDSRFGRFTPDGAAQQGTE